MEFGVSTEKSAYYAQIGVTNTENMEKFTSATESIVNDQDAVQKVKETLETVDEAYSIKLVPDRKMMTANNTDVLHVVAQLVDKKGREVKNVDDEIKFTISGDYRFLGTDCGKTEKMDSFKKKMVKTEFGRCLLMIQSTKTPSDITITATNESGSLKSKPLVIPVKEFN